MDAEQIHERIIRSVKNKLTAKFNQTIHQK